jgi:hypothetical protein
MHEGKRRIVLESTAGRLAVYQTETSEKYPEISTVRSTDEETAF